MAELNFGLLTPPGSENIANAFVRGQDQARATQMQDMQIQQSMRQGQMAESQFKKAQDEETKLSQWYAKIAANGGPTEPVEIENQMIGSGVPKIADIGFSARMKRLGLEQERKRFAEANAQPAAMPMEAPVNMMPGVGAAPAGVNSLSAPPQARTAIDDLNRQIATNMALGTDQGYKNAERLQKQIDALNKRYTVGNTLMGAEGNVIGTAPQQPRLLTPEEEAQRVRIARESRPPAAPRPEAAPRTQQVTMRDGTLGIMNMDTGAITPSNLGGVPVKGKPSAFAEKNAAQRKQMGTDLGFAITQLADITKDGGLIDQSTGSGAGRLTDIAAGFIGEATPGAIAIGKIAPIADLALKMVPRFEGPQSNADTRSYKEAAGQLADPTLPTKIRKEAGKVVLRIMQERKNQFVTSDMAVESAAGGGEATPAVNIDALLNKYK